MHPEIYKQPKEQQKARNLQAPHRRLEAKKKKDTAYNNVFHYIICIPPSCITTYEKNSKPFSNIVHLKVDSDIFGWGELPQHARCFGKGMLTINNVALVTTMTEKSRD